MDNHGVFLVKYSTTKSQIVDNPGTNTMLKYLGRGIVSMVDGDPDKDTYPEEEDTYEVVCEFTSPVLDAMKIQSPVLDAMKIQSPVLDMAMRYQESMKPIQEAVKALNESMKPMEGALTQLNAFVKPLHDIFTKYQDNMKPMQSMLKGLNDGMKRLEMFEKLPKTMVIPPPIDYEKLINHTFDPKHTIDTHVERIIELERLVAVLKERLRVYEGDEHAEPPHPDHRDFDMYA